ncbi:hypothetical protein F4804DRAFT_344499 [Jackrogersella minutella]|nr:hypothetical protein F4804DRAFT_344499 [Jackrogersella minutella]
MEGTLLVPPDRGTIIGRAVWKPRYLVIGPQRDAAQSNTGFSQVAARIKDASSRSSKPPQKVVPDAIFLSIYKTRDDWEPVQQHSIASITESQVQMIAHRKQGPVLPTLAVQISPDPATDKLRKRRSSRTAGLTTTKESGPTTLWFRLGDDRSHTLDDWARCIQSLTQPEIPGRHPISPISPTSPTFINPFAPGVPRSNSEFYAATSSGSSSKTRKRVMTKSSSHTYGSSRDANVPYTSGSPSIRSRRSDLSSSHASSMAPITTTYPAQHYTTVHPSDLPSPATTVGEYHDQFIEGWTSAQGRSSTLSSPIRARESIGSAPGQYLPSLHSGSPPAPRETILDRAFQLRCIPGSDREVPGEEKLSSLARFEALMRQAEERQRVFEKEREKTIVKEPLKSTWEEDESEEGEAVEEDDDDDSDEDGFEQDLGTDEIGPSAQKALQFIANRHSGRSQWSQQSTRTVSTYNESGPSILRPHTAHSRIRPTAQRTNSQPHIPAAALEMSAIPSRVAEENVTRRNHEKRHSTSDVKRLSFNEFTKRLSGTSSLLLVQTNASASSSRGSSEIDGAQQTTPPRGALSPRGSALSPSERDERCRWRGSVGVFGANEGGFL